MRFFDKIDQAKHGGKIEKQSPNNGETLQSSDENSRSENNPPADCAAVPPISAGIEPRSDAKTIDQAPDRDLQSRVRPDDHIEAAPTNHPRRSRHDSQDNFKKSWPWLKDNLSSLLRSGWTRRALFQKSASRYPAGQWGVAWLDVWQKPDLAARIAPTGNIEFSFISGSRRVRQTATRPPARDNSAGINIRKQP